MMKDMNFFTPFLSKKDVKPKEKFAKNLPKLGFAMIIAGALFIVLAPISLFAYDLILTGNLNSMKDTLALPENVAVLTEIDSKRTQLDALNTASSDIGAKDTLVSSVEWITEERIQQIIDVMPKQLYVRTMTMNAGKIDISGMSVDAPAIAEYEHRLRNIDWVDALHVSTISGDNAAAKEFTMTFNVKGVIAQ